MRAKRAKQDKPGQQKPVQLGDVLTDPRTLASSGRIVDGAIEDWLTDCAQMKSADLGRVVKRYVSSLTKEEAGERVQAALDAIDAEEVGRFFQLCAQRRIQRR